jgi:hypothetical protein
MINSVYRDVAVHVLPAIVAIVHQQALDLYLLATGSKVVHLALHLQAVRDICSREVNFMRGSTQVIE